MAGQAVRRTTVTHPYPLRGTEHPTPREVRFEEVATEQPGLGPGPDLGTDPLFQRLWGTRPGGTVGRQGSGTSGAVAEGSMRCPGACSLG